MNIETISLIPVLDKLLLELLNSLSDEEWITQTIAKLWTVKDVASHLLDGNLRALSISRDGYWGHQPDKARSFQELVSFLNQMNMTWTDATKRLSPRVLITLLELTGKEYASHLQGLNPFDSAVFSVAWAGHEVSPNWFHIAREYTERFLHQQQIRDAVNKPGIMTKELFYPFIDTLMYAFPYTFKDIKADIGTTVSLTVSSDIGGQWNVLKTNQDWILNKNSNVRFDSMVTIDPDTAWKLFSKSWTPEQIMDKVEIVGDLALGKQVLSLVAVMA